MTGVIIVGTGDHARVVSELALAAGHEVRGFVEPDASRLGRLRQNPGTAILGSLDPDEPWIQTHAGSDFIVAIGANDVRRQVYERCLELGLRPLSLVHPTAVILDGGTVAAGAQVCAMALIGVSARVEVDAIVNTAATVDHDVIVESHAFIGPGARLAGRVRIGAGAHVGIGAVIREGTMIGAGALVAAGAVVVADVPPEARVAGVPARPMDGDPEHIA